LQEQSQELFSLQKNLHSFQNGEKPRIEIINCQYSEAQYDKASHNYLVILDPGYTYNSDFNSEKVATLLSNNYGEEWITYFRN